LSDLFEGPISIALAYDDDPAIAFKLSDECRKTYSPNYTLKGGVFEGTVVPEDEVAKYAALPSREELLTKLASMLASPMRAMAFMLQAKIRELAIVLNEIKKQREDQKEEA